jgi:GNAT superfamily N-acetyltransferase
MSEQKSSPTAIKLTIMNLHDQSEFDELIQQRIACGWNFAPADIEKYRTAMDKKLKSLFWITVDEDPIRIGHVSLDSYANPPDPELALADKTILTIQTFFILKSHQSGGVGGRVMDKVEELATKEPYGSPNCKEVTINTLSTASLERGLPGWLEIWEKAGVPRPDWSLWSKEDWYAKRGYVKWKEEVRYTEDTNEAKVASLEAAFMRKTLHWQSLLVC